jgi:DNA-binding response OmpR family regulator
LLNDCHFKALFLLNTRQLMKNQSILVVEDNDALRFGFSRFLSKKGFLVTEACCLAEARIRMESETFGAIILDIQLPDGNGIDFLREIRTKCLHTTRIVISANPQPHDCLKNGAHCVLSKPVSMDFLHASLLRMMEQDR